MKKLFLLVFITLFINCFPHKYEYIGQVADFTINGTYGAATITLTDGRKMTAYYICNIAVGDFVYNQRSAGADCIITKRRKINECNN